MLRTRPVDTVIFAFNAVSSVSAVLSFLPFFGVGRFAYRLFIFSSLARYLSVLVQANGFPKFNSEYAIRAFGDINAQYALLAVFLFAGRPSTLAMVPLLLTQIFHFASFLYPLLKSANSGLAQQLATQADTLLCEALKREEPNWANRSEADKWLIAWRYASTLSCMAEVMNGIFLIFELITPGRQFMMVLLYWQYLHLRYVLEQAKNKPQEAYLANAFRDVDNRILTLTSHRYAPAFLRTAYGYVRDFMQKRATQMLNPDAQRARPSCVVM
jgi:hypothetical protein